MNHKQETIHHSVDQLFRQRAGQMVATLTRLFGIERLELVEDAVQDALVQALRVWPLQGVPDNPSAWLIQVAKHRLLDQLRRANRMAELPEDLESTVAAWAASDDALFANEIRDDQLRMIFACCHPQIPPDSQLALILKTVGGFSVKEIARAFLAQEAAIAKLLVRAKQRLREYHIRLEMPAPDRLAARLEAALKAIYLIFNEGYSALEGEELVRTDLCFEAVRLSELLAAHPVTGTPKAHALAALLLFQTARLPGRSDAAGELLLLPEQDRSRWDRALLRCGLEQLRAAASGTELSDYHIEAEIASCHAVAENFAATDWPRVLWCYEELARRNPSPVVALNRIVAFAQVQGAQAGLLELEQLRGQRVLQHYYPLYAVRGELLRETGQMAAALDCYEKALGLTSSEPLRRFLRKRIDSTATRMKR